jgi:cold shock protein
MRPRARARARVGEGDNADPLRHSEVPLEREGANSDPSRHSEVPPQLAGPPLGEPPAPTVWGKLKWYNPGKRYGFVELTDGSGDAFLHASAIEGMSIGALQPGVMLEFRTAPAQRGLQVAEVISLEQHRSPTQVGTQGFQIAIRAAAFGGERPRDGDGEVVQRH